MNILENIKEGLRSIQANLLRSVLTALIVAIGITALVGMLTTVDGIEHSVNESLSSLGVNTFDIKSRTNRNRNTEGLTQKRYPQITMGEAFKFIDQYRVPATISLNAYLTGIAEVKRLSKSCAAFWTRGVTGDSRTTEISFSRVPRSSFSMRTD